MRKESKLEYTWSTRYTYLQLQITYIGWSVRMNLNLSSWTNLLHDVTGCTIWIPDTHCNIDVRKRCGATFFCLSLIMAFPQANGSAPCSIFSAMDWWLSIATEAPLAHILYTTSRCFAKKQGRCPQMYVDNITWIWIIGMHNFSNLFNISFNRSPVAANSRPVLNFLRNANSTILPHLITRYSREPFINSLASSKLIGDTKALCNAHLRCIYPSRLLSIRRGSGGRPDYWFRI